MGRWLKRNTKSILSLWMVLVLVLGLTACGKTEEPVTTTPMVSSIPEPEPEPEFDYSTAEFLTGQERTADYPEGQRMVAVMVNNIIGSRPTMGLSEAKILVEIKVEGGITRFMALYDDYTTMPTVGGVRSARDQFLQLVIPFQPFYIHEGPSEYAHPVNEMMRTYDLTDFDMQDAGFRRDRPGMSYEYKLYTSGERVMDSIERKDRDWYRQYNSPIFSFIPYTDPYRVPDEGSAGEIAVIHSNDYRTFFEYSPETGRYMMSQRDYSGITPTVDEGNGQQLGYDNVLVLFAGMTLYNASPLVKVDYAAGGAGYYFTQGGWETVYWSKSAPNGVLELYSLRDREQVLQLNPGTTYIAVVDDDNLESFDDVLRAGTASDAVNEGEIDPNQVDTED